MKLFVSNVIFHFAICRLYWYVFNFSLLCESRCSFVELIDFVGEVSNFSKLCHRYGVYLIVYKCFFSMRSLGNCTHRPVLELCIWIVSFRSFVHNNRIMHCILRSVMWLFSIIYSIFNHFKWNVISFMIALPS